MSSKAERLAEALTALLDEAPEIEAAAVVSPDGLPMASILPPEIQEEQLAAMSAALLTLGERAATGLGKGGLDQVFIEGEDGFVVLMAAGDGAVLVVIAREDAKAGLVIYELRRAAEVVAGVMSASGSADEELEGPQNDEASEPADPLFDPGFEMEMEGMEMAPGRPEPVMDAFATPTDPFTTPPPPPPPTGEDDEEIISSWG